MDDVKRKALFETLKSIGRGLWFGILGLVAVALTALASSGAVSDINVTVAGLTVNLSVVKECTRSEVVLQACRSLGDRS